MSSPTCCLCLTVLVLIFIISGSAYEFHANFGTAPSPFTIDVKEAFITKTKEKLALTRFADDMEQEDLLDGPTRHNASSIRDFWLDEYDWYETQDSLNDRSAYNADVPLHFVHHKSPRSGAIPLLFIHGWPGSFIEVGPVIDHLTSPQNASLPAFHVVAPSIPGFAFSPPPTKSGYGYIEAAHTFDALMQQLGYARYAIQGGDAGGIIMRYQAHLYPDAVVSGLNNFWVVSPNEQDRATYLAGQASDDESAIIERMDYFMTHLWGYGQIHQTRPLRLAHAMTDSPIGLAMWIYDGLWPAAWDPSLWTPKEIITWTMMHCIPGPYAGFSIYKQGGLLGGAFNATHFADLPYVTQPMAISEFPKDLWYRTPLEWAQRTGNVKIRYLHGTGGHFPAWENPELLVEDMWAFFGDCELSNTRVFLDQTGSASVKDEL